ncbi:hypothetical protein D3C73_740400 [compost metagenome]
MQGTGYLARVSVIKIDACHRILARRGGGLLDDRLHLPLFIELQDAVSLGILHMIGKQSSAFRPGAGLLKLTRQLGAIEDVVAQNKAAGTPGQKRLCNQQGLCQSIGLILHRVAKTHPPLAAIPQQQFETGQIQWRADDQDVTDTRLHQGRQGVIDHGFIVDGQQLLADGQSRRIEPGGRTTGQYDAFTLDHGTPWN